MLGEHDINIAEWRMGRTALEYNSQTSVNLSFINLDLPTEPDVLAELTRLERVISVQQIILD